MNRRSATSRFVWSHGLVSSSEAYPSVLCCHIQRRYYDPFTGKMEKCVQFVEFPQFLDLSPYCAYGSRAITPWAAGSLPNASSTPTDLPKQPLQAWNHAFHSETRGNDDGMPYQLQSVIEHRGNAFGGFKRAKPFINFFIRKTSSICR